jgi:hypothetical protein
MLNKHPNDPDVAGAGQFVEENFYNLGSFGGQRQEDVYRITNSSSSIVDTHLLVIARGLPGGIQMENASGMTIAGDPYFRVFGPMVSSFPARASSRHCASGGSPTLRR